MQGGFVDSNNIVDFNFDDEINMVLYIVFEYLVLFLFNVKVNYMILDNLGIIMFQFEFIFDGELFIESIMVNIDVEFDVIDFILYYELFDNDLVSFDLGVNVKYIDGVLFVVDRVSDISGFVEFFGIVLMVYLKVQLGLLFIGLLVYFEGSYLLFDDYEFSDY